MKEIRWKGITSSIISIQNFLSGLSLSKPSIKYPVYLIFTKKKLMSEILGIGSRVQHAEYGKGVVIQVKSNSYTITFMDHGVKEMLHTAPLTVLEKVEPASDIVSMQDVEKVLARVLYKWVDMTEKVELGNKWLGGTLIMKPGQKDMQPKEIPIDTFFHKIVMVRDRLRVLEQNINASKNLSDEEKVNMQQYITRIYGSLTSFNILFKNAEQNFVGEKGKE